MEQCPHERQDLRRRIVSNGIEHFVMQCLICGSHVRAVPKAEIGADQRDAMPLFDEGIRDRYWADIDQHRREHAEQVRASMRAEYAEYLRSPQWSRKRNARLAMDGGRCQARLDGCLGTATEVHHLDYRYIRNEPLFNLVSVCRPCHEQISVMEGRVRQEDAA